MTPEQFVSALDGLIAAAPHGQQGEALQKVIALAEQNPKKAAAMLGKLQPTGTCKYLEDFIKTKASNIMLISKLATLFFGEEQAAAVLDMINLNAEHDPENEEENDLYNSEGDGYSH